MGTDIIERRSIFDDLAYRCVLLSSVRSSRNFDNICVVSVIMVTSKRSDKELGLGGKEIQMQAAHLDDIYGVPLCRLVSGASLAC